MSLQSIWQHGASPAHKPLVRESWGRYRYVEPSGESVMQRQDPQSVVQTGSVEAAYGDFGNLVIISPTRSSKNDTYAEFAYAAAQNAVASFTALINTLSAGSTVALVGRSTAWPYLSRSTLDTKTLYDMLHSLFRSAVDETFKDGMDSYFSIQLHRIILNYGVDAVDALERVLDGTNVGVAEEALRQIGYIDDVDTHKERLSLLENALKSPDVGIRDGASIGIEAMDDPASIESLRTAIKNEPHVWLRQYLQDVLEQLQDVR